MYGFSNNYDSRDNGNSTFRSIVRKVIKKYVKLYKEEDNLQDLHDTAPDSFQDAMSLHR